jgi:DNA modification methylase
MNTQFLNKIIQSEAIAGLQKLPDQSINCCVTSPPYWGLRDYGMPDQIGLEATPEEYIEKLVAVFREVKRVLRDDGTLWVNMGDSYASGAMTPHAGQRKDRDQSGMSGIIRKPTVGLKQKDLVGIPWMLAFALRAYGWYLRQDIIWSKPNPMPESVTDRCTKAHEYIFLLSKSHKYYFDQDSIKQPPAESTIGRGAVSFGGEKGRNYKPDYSDPNFRNGSDQWGRMYQYKDGDVNRRSVWTVATKPFKEAHFATFPEELIIPCIKAGCPQDGIVLDPFMGAGTTAIVAYNSLRNFVGVELNPDYIKIAEKRLKPHVSAARHFAR